MMKKRFMSILLTLCMMLTLLPATAMAANNYNAKLKEGWYYLRCMGNYLNLDANGKAELRDKTNTPEGNTKFRVHYWGTGAYGLETQDGRYLGIEGTIKDGVRVKTVAGDPNAGISKDPMFRWDIYSENDKDIWSLRPRMNKDIFMNASGQKSADGTPIILWTHIDRWLCPSFRSPDAPNHGEFRFIHADTSWVDPGAPKTPADGWYQLDVRPSAWDGHRNTIFKRNINIHKNGGAEIDVMSCIPGTYEFYVQNMGNKQITLRMGDGRYLGIADPIKNGVRVKAVKTPYLWNSYSEKKDYGDHDNFSLRPSTNTNMILNVSGQKAEVGTPIILWEYTKMDAPSHAEFTFNVLSKDKVPAKAVTPPVPVVKPGTPSMSIVTATPSKTSFMMNSHSVSVTAAYTINGTNYLQLRAIAALLNGTAAQFDVGWDGQYAVIEPGKPYSSVISETKLQNTTNIRKSDTKFKLNGKVFTFSDARLIAGDTNYLQLREFAQKISGTASQFNIYWDDAVSKAVIQPGVAYTGLVQ
ncbi:hypothetical protein SAMN00017405_0671 [Desulfonispora thiosulfatigenes DSM 11270]|uniref:Copper amine oxidase N-terminal domain-containing protein n=1 Tax=Desulfonispora thiosulfatigenes DSM 11270 TaxID=656914 RepID=A0A1W1V984_DESTI|nr:RICIN domain-containing protein [Desulfonispora thiosulfatigenes]SMB89878.1 hypothetical protein SAMN00017405_0671 [Desulfonispora thiosulfatigenes DSM 11270]